jgi:hypothetical protein
MRRTLIFGALAMFAIGCASAPPPPPKQAEQPIRTQDDIARDQAAGGPIVDPAQCQAHPLSPGCPKTANPDAFANSRAGQRAPRLLQH